MRKKEKHFFSEINRALVGDEKTYTFEQRFVNSLSLGICAASFIGALINFLLSLNFAETFLTLVNALVYFCIYCLSRFLNRSVLAKWSAILFAFFVLTFLWLNSAGSSGPIPYTYFLLILSIVLITDGWPRMVLLIMTGLNISALFYLEEVNNSWVVAYIDDTSRRIDMVASLLLYFLLGTVIMSFAKRSYITARKKAEESDKLKTAFLANMSHEIRTPMNAIIGFSGLLKNNNLSTEKKNKYYKTVEENVEYLLRLIDDILDIARIEADELNIEPKQFHLDEFMKSLELSHKQLIPERKKDSINFFYENPGRQDIMFNDDIRLEQIMTNLLANAIKFTETGYVKFGYKKREQHIVFYVTDSGLGIEESDKEKIFDRFVKLDTTNDEILQRGTGIGLSIAKKIVGLLDGEIWLESSPGQGSTFFVSIPVKNKKVNRQYN